MAHDVFISYSTKDEIHVQTLRSVLDANKISYWIAPRDIPGGSNYAKEIPSAIRSCSVFLLVLSQNAEASIWVSRELDLAVNSRKVILPLMVEDFSVGDEFNFLLTGCQRYEVFRRKSEVLETMVKRIQSVLGIDVKKPASEKPAPKQTPTMPASKPKAAAPNSKSGQKKPSSASAPKPAPQKAPPAPAPNPAGKKIVEKLPFTPTPSDVWNKPKHEFIRTDGIYQSQLKNGAYRYLRFSPLNYSRVFHIYSPCLPCEVMRWFYFTGVQEGVCTYSKTDVHLRIASSMIFMGSVGKNTLSLRSYFADNNTEDEYTFTFIPFPESSRLPDGILGFADDPVHRFKLLFAGNPQPRYDGYYCSDETGEGKTYLRFYPTGEVYETFHVGAAREALPKLKIANRNGGIRFHAKYSLNRSIIRFAIEHPVYKTKIRYHGKITEDGLLMETHYSTFDRTVVQKYTFHKVNNEFF